MNNEEHEVLNEVIRDFAFYLAGMFESGLRSDFNVVVRFEPKKGCEE